MMLHYKRPITPYTSSLRGSICFTLALLFASTVVFTQTTDEERRWNEPIEPFRIIGNVYYVGAAEVTSFLVTTPKGHFLIDSGFADTVPQIKENVRKLGFNVEDIKVLLNTQAHYDHAGGLAEMKRLTRAKTIASVADKRGLELGGRNDFTWGDRFAFEPVVVDKVIVNNDRVTYGGVTLRAVLTPGHTKGCTAWLLDVRDNGRKHTVIFLGSASSPGYQFYGNDKYPQIIADFRKTFSTLKKLSPDIFLASHGGFFDLLGKAQRLKAQTPGQNPFIDPKGYRKYVADSDAAFRKKLVEQKPKPRFMKKRSYQG